MTGVDNLLFLFTVYCSLFPIFAPIFQANSFMEYDFRSIEQKWRSRWSDQQTFKAEDNSTKPKYYVLDMFPYPSGAGLHVGHPLGYIASDIYARYKRLKGFNVLHPMGYDSFGLPAEQYAIQTGQHPAITTQENIARYRDQLDKIGFSFDWSREVRTSNPDYYKWTQWIFIQLFNSWYNPRTDRAENIETLEAIFATEGFSGSDHDILTGDIEKDLSAFTVADWKGFDEIRKREILMFFRLAYLGEAYVNWCPALGTVLANDEVVNGVSERGGHPVERKLLKQWSMRITAYAQRLIDGLDTLDWTDSIKEAQRNWIGRSEGASLRFEIIGHKEEILVFTTRPDTIFGVAFVTLAPEHELVTKVTTAERRQAVEEYVTKAKNRSERERMADVNTISGVFTGSYAKHPFTGQPVPIWIGDYVLVGYGTGAVMAVPGHDERDHKFAKHFDLPVMPVIAPTTEHDFDLTAWGEKEGTLVNSDFLDGLAVKAAIKKAVDVIAERGLGQKRINYRLRDAVFGRQRYWGEPIPIYYKDGVPYAMDENELPLTLPEVDKYLPTEDGEPPLARAEDWKYKGQYEYELSTMPGWAGSSWYFLRYMDPNNEGTFADRSKIDYWKQVDLYIGGSEHATGHLLYARFWTKFLKDRELIGFDEPFQKMINQGMILGRSSFVYVHYPVGISGLEEEARGKDFPNELKKPIFISKELLSRMCSGDTAALKKFEKLKFEKNQLLNKLLGTHSLSLHSLDTESFFPSHVDISLVDNDRLDIDAFRNWREEFKNAEFHCEDDGTYICGHDVEKMSKSKYNVQTPDELVEKFGADTLRMYEMFLGPLEQFKPWDTKGINGVHNFLRKLWRLFENEGAPVVSDEPASKESLKTLHKTIKKLEEDLERFSFNTGVSGFMICVNELTDQKCHSREVLESLVILLAPYAPHLAEELWEKLGHTTSVSYATFPKFNPEYLVEANFAYPVSFNGKTRFTAELPADFDARSVESAVMALEETAKWLEGKDPKKIIIVPGRIVNIVV